MIWLFLSPILWIVTTLATGFALTVAVTVAWRAYSIVYARRNLLPVSSRSAVLITGATSGIGLAVAKHLFKIGYSVVACYFDAREPGFAELKQLANKLKSSGGQKMIFIELDVRSEESIRNAYDQCQAQLGAHQLSLYGLINNAGLGSLQPYAWLQRKTIRSMIETNLLGCMLMTREFLPLIIQARGRVLNVSSGLALIPGATYASYGTTKSALLYFSTCMNMELDKQFGVKTVAVIPHNAIKTTNICAHNVKNNESAWEELKPIERQLYKSQFDEHLVQVRSLSKATKEQSQKASTAAKKRAGSNTDESLLKRITAVLSCLTGESEDLTWEESGVLECYEDALRLADPPEHIFAGNHVYNLVVGSLLLSLPTSCLGVLGLKVAPNLYR